MNARSITRKTSGAGAGALTVVGTVQAFGKDEIPEGLDTPIPAEIMTPDEVETRIGTDSTEGREA